MHSIHNEGKSFVAERFIRALENKIYKYMTSISKTVYSHKLDDIVNKYDKTYHKTIKMKSIDVKKSRYIDFNNKNNKEGCKVKVADHVRISEYKNLFAKGYVPNQSEVFFVIKKVKNNVPWTYVTSDLICEEIIGMFCKKELRKKKIKKSLELKK